MFTQRIRQLSLTYFVVCVVAACLVSVAVPAAAADISWRSTSARTSDQGMHYAYEGTATFTSGEEGHLVGNGTRDENSSPKSGTGSGEVLYRFTDGSSFTIHFLSIWSATTSRNAGIFTSGTGRFEGIFGTCTAIAERPASGPTVTVWTGTYELSPK